MLVERRRDQIDSPVRPRSDGEGRELRGDRSQLGLRPGEKDEAIIRNLGERGALGFGAVPHTALVPAAKPRTVAQGRIAKRCREEIMQRRAGSSWWLGPIDQIPEEVLLLASLD